MCTLLINGPTKQSFLFPSFNSLIFVKSLFLNILYILFSHNIWLAEEHLCPELLKDDKIHFYIATSKFASCKTMK